MNQPTPRELVQARLRTGNAYTADELVKLLDAPAHEIRLACQSLVLDGHATMKYDRITESYTYRRKK